MTGSKNEDFIKFRNSILVALAVTLICVAAVIVLFGNGLSGGPVNKKMKNKESFLIYITQDDCSDCAKIRKFLKDKNVTFEEIDEHSQQAKKIFKTYDFVTDESVSPAVIYVKKGKIYSNLVNLSDTDELGEFVDYYKLSK